MAYPPASNFPSRQQTQHQQSLHNNYQPDNYPQQDFTQQGQDTFSQPNLYSQTSFTQRQNYPQDSFSQQLQTLSEQQTPYSLPSSSYPQSGSFNQQPPPPQSHLGQTQRQQFPQQNQLSHTQFTQPYISQSQQSQQTFTQYPQNQYSQTSSTTDQNSYPQQNPQPNNYPQSSQAQGDRDQRNSPVPSNLYNLQNRTAQPNLQTSLVQQSQFSAPGAQISTNGFSQQTPHGQQQQFSQVRSPHLNQQGHFNGQSAQSRGTAFSQQQQQQQSDQLVQRSHSLPYSPQLQQQAQQRHSSGDVAGTYQLFFTGRDDPRCCMLIGEDTKPVYLSFETQESNLNQTIRTMVYKNTKDLCAKLEWGTGGFLGSATIGERRFPMADLVVPGSSDNARRFVSIDGQQFEWRRVRDDTAAYDLFMAPDVRIALFRKYNQPTPIGPSHGLIQYTFSNDVLLIEALLALLLNRWIDINGIHFTG